jgi:hypothetical protein
MHDVAVYNEVAILTAKTNKENDKTCHLNKNINSIWCQNHHSHIK